VAYGVGTSHEDLGIVLEALVFDKSQRNTHTLILLYHLI